MSCPNGGPCTPFVDEIDICCLVSGALGDPCLTNGTPVPQSVIDNAIMAASEVLWTATGRQFGTCTVTIRPCKKSGCNPCPDGGELPFFGAADFGYGFSYPWYPIHTANGWINVSCPCSDSCGCSALCEISLPYPVCSVDEVVIDGIILDESEYRVDDFAKLVRIAPSGVCWPECQDLTLPDTEEGTFSVTVTYGRPVPTIVQLATAALACEFIKSCVGQPCQLPQRVQNMTRQGVTIGFLDPMEFIDQGLTGIYIVDMAIKRYNPKNLLKQASVYSPDTGRRWRRVGT